MNWNDSGTFWLNMTNIALGVVVIVAVVAIVFRVVLEIVQNARQSRQIDRELKDLVSSYNGDVFVTPGLGPTMADGGEPIEKKKP